MKKNYKKWLCLFLSASCALSFTSSRSQKVSFPSKIGERVKEKKMKKEDQMYKTYFEKSLLSYPDGLSFSKKEIQKLIESAFTTQDCKNTFDGNVQEIIEKIKKNTEDYLQKYPSYQNPFTQEDLSFFIESILEDILEDLCFSGNDYSEDLCRMQELSLVVSNQTEKENVFATHIASEHVIILYDQTMKKMEKNQANFLKELKLTLEHEINHDRQYACDCRKNQTYKNFDYTKDYSTFLKESSAESELYNLHPVEKQENSYSYLAERSYESFLLLLSLFKEDATIEDYYNSIFDTNLLYFYDFFDLSNEQDLVDFYNILYSMDATLGNNNYVYDYYQKNTLGLKEAKKAVGYTYKNNLWNLVLSDMVSYTSTHEDFSFEENMTLFLILEDLFQKDYSTEKSANYIYDPTYLQEFTSSKETYLQFLEEHYKKEVSSYEEKGREEAKHIRFLLYEDSLDSSVAAHLLKRFPLLKSILYPFDEYDNFLNKEEKAYQKVKK